MNRSITLFPLLALIGVAIALGMPEWLVGLKPAIVPLLGVVMFGMGITLTLDDFASVTRRPGIILLGMALQYGVMPLAGWLIGLSLGLPSALLVGFVLLGASPGGTASNVICYLARGDVALSITLTTVSTLAAVLLTPALTWLYVGERVPVPALDMLISIAKIILAPVALGLLINRFLGARLERAKQVFPLVSMAAILVIIAIIVALNHSSLVEVGRLVLLAVVLHNAVGLLSGYWAARALGQDRRSARTLAIEVGMQNSGLAVALAVKYFSAASALPGALFSVWHNLSGAALASWWSRRDAADEPR
ncbi:bile acid:sodium symporter family protein [Thiorhodococcus mannitoliphagus]|uniref:Bile acid:sodium symporter family protein n=1 Tax=Thiorhodococcus mannitoliphagus TaxID=329406 RepID=A0A6P1DVA7_9GAMM|nr:bile acid:sodium symporter family protein [Thiorhodococcus mannitoliphagus]NEX21659.1 bile acid:sodium symporter family protein [Thiorhodococcus mannitoliphagus]